MRPTVSIVCLLGAGLIAGCDSKPTRVPTHPVSGQVLYAGKPAAGVHVFLLPTSAPMVPAVPANPHGVTGADGRFKLSTYGNDDGAPEGGYQVMLHWPPETKEGEDQSDEESDTDRLLGWYSAATSKLTVEVKPGDNTLPAWDLPARNAPPPKSEGIPGRN